MRGLYGIVNAQKDKKGISEMPVNRKMRRGNFEYLHSNKVTYCKRFDRRSVAMLFIMLKELQQHLLFPAGKMDQRQNSKYLAQTLSEYTTKEWVVLN